MCAMVGASYEVSSGVLSNGLRVVVNPNPGLGVVAVNLWYDVGSRHESPERQGFAHLFEHLMFQGSRHVKAGDHFALLQSSGASLNATTSFDRTNYFESGPAGILDLALWLEADRMAFLDDVLTERNFKNQVDVVSQERAQRMDNVPYGTIFEKILPLIFDSDHPYGHLPIGNMQQLAEATLEEVSAFHAMYYMPDNAVLAIVGDTTADIALEKADRYFGHIPPGTPPERAIQPSLPPVEKVQRLDISEDVPAPAVWFATRFPPDGPMPRALAAAALAASILGEGETSHLHRRLVRRDQTAVSAGLGVNSLIAGNSIAVASVRAAPGQDLDPVVGAVIDVLEGFADRGPTDEELAIAIAQAERDWIEEMGSAAGRADALANAALLYGDANLINDRLPLLRSIAVAEVRQAARDWIVPCLNSQARVVPDGGEARSADLVEESV